MTKIVNNKVKPQTDQSTSRSNPRLANQKTRPNHCGQSTTSSNLRGQLLVLWLNQETNFNLYMSQTWRYRCTQHQTEHNVYCQSPVCCPWWGLDPWPRGFSLPQFTGKANKARKQTLENDSITKAQRKLSISPYFPYICQSVPNVRVLSLQTPGNNYKTI